MVKYHKGNSAKYTPPTPTHTVRRQIIVPRGVTKYQSLPDRKLLMTMSVTTMTTNKREIRTNNTPPTPATLARRQMIVIPEDYDHGDNDG